MLFPQKSYHIYNVDLSVKQGLKTPASDTSRLCHADELDGYSTQHGRNSSPQLSRPMPIRSRTVKAETQCFTDESVDVLAKYISFL